MPYNHSFESGPLTCFKDLTIFQSSPLAVLTNAHHFTEITACSHLMEAAQAFELDQPS